MALQKSLPVPLRMRLEPPTLVIWLRLLVAPALAVPRAVLRQNAKSCFRSSANKHETRFRRSRAETLQPQSRVSTRKAWAAFSLFPWLLFLHRAGVGIWASAHPRRWPYLLCTVRLVQISRRPQA